MYFFFFKFVIGNFVVFFPHLLTLLLFSFFWRYTESIVVLVPVSRKLRLSLLRVWCVMRLCKMPLPMLLLGLPVELPNSMALTIVIKHNFPWGGEKKFNKIYMSSITTATISFSSSSSHFSHPQKTLFVFLLLSFSLILSLSKWMASFIGQRH